MLVDFSRLHADCYLTQCRGQTFLLNVSMRNLSKGVQNVCRVLNLQTFCFLSPTLIWSDSETGTLKVALKSRTHGKVTNHASKKTACIMSSMPRKVPRAWYQLSFHCKIEKSNTFYWEFEKNRIRRTVLMHASLRTGMTMLRSGVGI